MKPAAVYIATTEGPSAVLRITAEDPDVRSVVCLAGKAVALPISADYDAFVRRPTGVVEACFGHGAYRVDISDPIAGGLSWQLGIFVAHALADERCLAGPADDAGRVIWASGEVTRDLTVEPVHEVALKIRRSEGLFRALLDRGATVFLLVAVPDREEAAGALAELFGDESGAFRLVPSESACGVLSEIGLRRRRPRRWLPRTLGHDSRHGTLSRTALYAVSAALSVSAIVTGWSRFGDPPWPAADRIARAIIAPAVAIRATPPVAAVAVETRPAAARSCADVTFDLAPARVTRRAASRISVAPVSATDLCDFRYEVTNRSGRALLLWALATRTGGPREGFRLRRPFSARALQSGETVAFDARPATRLSTPLSQGYVVLSSPAQSAGDGTRLARLMAGAGGATTPGDVKGLIREAKRLGASVLAINDEFVP